MHAEGCLYTEGDWFCARGCTHERDEYVARLEVEHQRYQKALEKISSKYWTPPHECKGPCDAIPCIARRALRGEDEKEKT